MKPSPNLDKTGKSPSECGESVPVWVGLQYPSVASWAAYWGP